ncbi:uncharacterized protein LOC143469373 [Clavelina lepadiformis]|uniref:uncharacterized protein LOC143469373 n=1 Tax=Clavelina lepadiformis TaxID=159417 RepID=UPI0040421BCA
MYKMEGKLLFMVLVSCLGGRKGFEMGGGSCACFTNHVQYHFCRAEKVFLLEATSFDGLVVKIDGEYKDLELLQNVSDSLAEKPEDVINYLGEGIAVDDENYYPAVAKYSATIVEVFKGEHDIFDVDANNVKVYANLDRRCETALLLNRPFIATGLETEFDVCTFMWYADYGSQLLKTLTNNLLNHFPRLCGKCDVVTEPLAYWWGDYDADDPASYCVCESLADLTKVCQRLDDGACGWVDHSDE